MRMTEEEYAAYLKRKDTPALKKGKPEAKCKQSAGEILFANQLELSGITGWLPEYKFHPSRKWRFDFAHAGTKIAVEIEGICYGDKKGRHQTASGLTGDCEKYNAAVELGWRVFRFTPAMVKDETAINTILRVMK